MSSENPVIENGTEEPSVPAVTQQQQKKSGWGSAFSAVTGSVSSTVAGTASAIGSGVINTATTVSKIFEKPPLPEIDIEGLIGRFVMSEFGGTRFEGQLPKEFNEKLPPMLAIGSVLVSLHERGIRIDQKKGYPLLIQQSAAEEVSLQRQSIKRTTGVASDLATCALDGAIGGGLLGAGLATSKAALTGKIGSVETIVIFYVRTTFTDEEGKKWTLTIQADPAFAEQFIQRTQEREWPS